MQFHFLWSNIYFSPKLFYFKLFAYEYENGRCWLPDMGFHYLWGGPHAHVWEMINSEYLVSYCVCLCNYSLGHSYYTPDFPIIGTTATCPSRPYQLPRVTLTSPCKELCELCSAVNLAIIQGVFLCLSFCSWFYEPSLSIYIVMLNCIDLSFLSNFNFEGEQVRNIIQFLLASVWKLYIS